MNDMQLSDSLLVLSEGIRHGSAYECAAYRMSLSSLEKIIWDKFHFSFLAFTRELRCIR